MLGFEGYGSGFSARGGGCPWLQDLEGVVEEDTGPAMVVEEIVAGQGDGTFASWDGGRWQLNGASGGGISQRRRI